LLTAVCIHMAQIAAVMHQESPEETLQELNAHLGGSLAVWSLGTEVVFRLGASLMAKLHFPDTAALALWAVLGVACTVLLAFAREAPPLPVAASDAGGPAKSRIRSKLCAFFAIWPDPKLWLIGFINYAFFFQQAFITNVVNPQFVAPMLGKQAIGVAMALVSIAGAILAKLYGYIGAYAGKGSMLIIASASFAVFPAAVLFTNFCSNGGWLVLVLYFWYGSGRAVHEGIGRAVFADYFPGPLLDPAFANYNFQGSAMAVVANFAQTVSEERSLAVTAFSLAVAIAPTFALASALRGPEEHPNPDEGDEDDDEEDDDDDEAEILELEGIEPSQSSQSSSDEQGSNECCAV